MSDPIEPGRMIGPYEVIREIGRGGMGIVYEAHEASLNRAIALKVLPDHLAANPGFVQRFTREAQSAAALQHPGIVAIHSVGKDGNDHFIAMEFITGTTLADQIERDGPLEVPRALEIAAQICDALAEAHSKGIVHRDVKPHNIMIEEKGRVKMTDFGLAKAVNDQTLTTAGFILGTPTHMSPEQCNGQPADHRSDLYSVGVVLYEMLTGQAPFTGETPLSLMLQIVNKPFPSVREKLPKVPLEVARIVERFVERNPEARYQSGDAAAAALRAALANKAPNEHPAHHDPTLLVESLPEFKKAKRGARRAMVLGAVGTLLCVLVLWGSLRIRRAFEGEEAGAAKEAAEWSSPEAPAYVSPFDEPSPEITPIEEAVEPAIEPLEAEAVPAESPDGLPQDLLDRVRTGTGDAVDAEPARSDPIQSSAPSEPTFTPAVEETQTSVQKWTDVLDQVDEALSGNSGQGGGGKAGNPGQGKGKGKKD